MIMKRLGVQKSVLVARQLYLGAIYTGFCAMLTTLVLWVLVYRDCIGLAIFVLFVILYLIQVNLRQVVFSHLLPARIAFTVISILVIF